MEHIFPKPNDRAYLLGLLSILISLIVFCIPQFYTAGNNIEGVCFANFGIAVFYGIAILVAGAWKKDNRGIIPQSCWAVLCLISCYALNRELSVFETTVPWFAIVMIVSAAQMLAFAFFDYLPSWGQHVLYFCAGIAMMAFLYLAIYLLPLYAISALLFWVLGFTLHTFVPLLCGFYTFRLLRKTSKTTRHYLISFYCGIGMVLIICVGYTVNWCCAVRQIDHDYQRTLVRSNTTLPAWIEISQHMPRNAMMERVLKTNIVYSTPTRDMSNMFWGDIPGRSFTEERKHDPLIMLATLFSGDILLPENDRIRVLESMYNARHQAQDRLHNGDDLETRYVNTGIQLWPALHLAYTELNVTVAGNNPGRYWSPQREAIYTFHIPEGGVATSLSLWIDGKEHKGILTSKEKADSAYKTIVGVESRDPSVVHWQEGNTVTVRVFPVMADSYRMFKIGITAPLPYKDGKLVYEPVYFEGPDGAHATEDVSIELKQDATDFATNRSFDKTDMRHYTYSGHYRANWNCTFDAPPQDTHSFSFAGNSYRMVPLIDKEETVITKTIYLDINKAWTRDDCEQAYALAHGKQVYVYTGGDEGLTTVTVQNEHDLFAQLRKNEFSLFPFYLISDATTSLVITKNADSSPSLSALKGSGLLNNLQTWFNAGRTLRLFDLGDYPSPYLSSLKASRAFHYKQGNIPELTALLQRQSFTADQENENKVVISSAHMAIERSVGTTPSQAPDHLMRLFAFNDILRRSGPRLLIGPVTDSTIIQEAQQAYVVSPVSSLVVLESQKDYDRFNIADSKNSLANASLKSKGAVPEPQEWALIILVAGLLVYAKFSPSRKLQAQ